jgi:hypothetical protein
MAFHVKWGRLAPTASDRDGRVESGLGTNAGSGTKLEGPDELPVLAVFRLSIPTFDSPPISL